VYDAVDRKSDLTALIISKTQRLAILQFSTLDPAASLIQINDFGVHIMCR
jgi:hypothetical protein